MKVLVFIPHARMSNEEIMLEIERLLPGYRKDDEGETYWFEADGDELVQVYNDEEKTIRWSIASIKPGGFGTKSEVELTC